MKNLEEKLAEPVASLVAFVHENEDNEAEVKAMVEQLREKYAGKANVMCVDSSFNRQVIRKYNINAYPTWIVFREGQELMRESGKKTATQLEELIARGM